MNARNKPAPMLWQVHKSLPRVISNDAGSQPDPNYAPGLWANNIVCGFLKELGMMGKDADTITPQGIEFLNSIGAWMPVNKLEEADLMHLLEWGPPRTELYWRWLMAIEEHFKRMTFRNAVEALQHRAA